MPLRLQIVSEHRTAMGEAHVMEFPARGGSIGRSLESDWPLPDAKRFLSAQHALIDFQAGAYYLIDTSRNGVFVNGADAPVGKGHPQRLFDGDRIRLGDYEIQVAIVGDDSDTTGDTMRDSIVRAQLVPEDPSMEMAMLPPGKITEDSALEQHLAASDSSAALSALHSRPPEPGITAQAMDQAVGILLKAMGMPPNIAAGVPATEVLHTAGQLLRELVTGVKDTQQLQSTLMQMFDLPTKDSGTADNNPLRFSPELEPALKYLFGDRNESYLSAPDGVRDAFRSISVLQQAMIKAMCHALEDYLTHFDPDAIKSKAAGQKKRPKALGGSNKSQYWELYEKLYGSLTRQNAKHIPQQFSEEFARAFEIELLSLKDEATV